MILLITKINNVPENCDDCDFYMGDGGGYCWAMQATPKAEWYLPIGPGDKGKDKRCPLVEVKDGSN